MSSGCDVTVALAGNPNVGKSTLFNVLTGETAHVGNWPGVTVELKEGIREHRGSKICFVDLPGTYGISATSMEEVIAREFIISGQPDIVAVLVDSTAPERTIYLAVQIMELVPNVLIVLTKYDEAHAKGVHIHVDKLEEYLGVPVVPVSAITGEGIRELLDAIVDFRKRLKRTEPLRIDYGGLEYFIREAQAVLEGSEFLKKLPITCRYCPVKGKHEAEGSEALKIFPSRWAAIMLLEGDPRLEEMLREAGEKEVLQKIGRLRESARRIIGKDLTEYVIKTRFDFVDSIIRKVVVRSEIKAGGDAGDIFQRPVVGALASFGLIFAVFLAVFSINTGFPLNIIMDFLGRPDLAEAIEAFSISGLVGDGFTALANAAAWALEPYAPEWFVSLLADGIITGIGSVLSFFPLILMVFLFLAALEDSGLAPRMAVSFHNFFSKFGLSGRAIYPFVVSLGCNVPGVMASRTSLDDEERVELVLSVPFIPCQARLVVALAFSLALFTSPFLQAGTIFLVYLIGILVALLTSVAVRRLYFKKREPPELLIEIPPIHKPKLKVVWWLTWDNTKHFLRKAGVIIFTFSIIVWALLYLGPTGYLPEQHPENFFEYSYAAIIGRWIAPILAPFGLNADQGWRVGFSLLNGFVAKEVVLDSLAVLYGGNVDPVAAIQYLGLTPAQGLAILVMIMLYLPCIATLAVMYQELRKGKLVLLALLYMLGVAYLVSLIVYGIMVLVT